MFTAVFVSAAAVGLAAYGCGSKGSSTSTPLGGEGQGCFSNATCDQGLVCSNNVCVAATTDGSIMDSTVSTMDAPTLGGDAGTGDVQAADSPSTIDAAVEGSTEEGGDAAANEAGADAGMDAPSTDSGEPDAGDGACQSPSHLHPPTMTPDSIYCPFGSADGGPSYCDEGTQHCCEPATGQSTCTGIATSCAAGDVDWQCEDPVTDCESLGNPVCCAPGASIVLGDAGCRNYSMNLTGTRCVASVAACTGIVMCTSNEECSLGQTCVPFDKGGNGVGGCM